MVHLIANKAAIKIHFWFFFFILSILLHLFTNDFQYTYCYILIFLFQPSSVRMPTFSSRLWLWEWLIISHYIWYTIEMKIKMLKEICLRGIRIGSVWYNFIIIIGLFILFWPPHIQYSIGNNTPAKLHSLSTIYTFFLLCFLFHNQYMSQANFSAYFDHNSININFL